MNKLHVYELYNHNNNNETNLFYPNIIVKTKSVAIIKQINWNSKRKWDNNFNKKHRNRNNHHNNNHHNNNRNNNHNNNHHNNNRNNNHNHNRNNNRYNDKTNNFKSPYDDNMNIDDDCENTNNKRLISAKNQIDLYYNKREWDCVKKITNPFELIYITNRYNKKNSISLYDPLSRSYFKMIEMLHEFLSDIHPSKNKTNLKTLHLAEGPGGFMEAFINYRENNNDIYYGMTLKSVNNNIPGWHKSNYFINKHTNLNIISGIDNMGDLYNIYNHYYVMNR